MSTQRRVSHLLTVLALVVTAKAHATPPTLAHLGVAYATKNNLPVRGVRMDLGTRQVERHFVPVLPATEADFYDTFQVGKGAMVWRSGQDPVHMAFSLSPSQRLSYGGAWGAGAVEPHGNVGRYVVLAVNEAQVAHWKGLVAQYSGANGQLHVGQNTYREQGIATPTGHHGGCMWWVVHAQLSQGLNLATAMGVRRAKGPEALMPRLIHAGNELVGPIGVPVANIEQFMAMTDQQLMGPEPAGGAADQVK